jgi:hypothetical protein
MVEHKKYNFSVNDVSEVYSGAGGQLWELLMGEQFALVDGARLKST